MQMFIYNATGPFGRALMNPIATLFCTLNIWINDCSATCHNTKRCEPDSTSARFTLCCLNVDHKISENHCQCHTNLMLISMLIGRGGRKSLCCKSKSSPSLLLSSPESSPSLLLSSPSQVQVICSQVPSQVQVLIFFLQVPIKS